jgi:hypothetical protein
MFGIQTYKTSFDAKPLLAPAPTKKGRPLWILPMAFDIYEGSSSYFDYANDQIKAYRLV